MSNIQVNKYKPYLNLIIVILFLQLHLFSNNQISGFSISSPNDGDSFSICNTITIEGTLPSDSFVKVVIDSKEHETSKINDTIWNSVLETGSIKPGTHTLVANLYDESNSELIATDSISITINAQEYETIRYSYESSKDNVPMSYSTYIPEGIEETEKVPLVIWLHGGGGKGIIPCAMFTELESRKWIAIAPDGRDWSNFDGCQWETSAAYFNHDQDDQVGPGETDIFDAIKDIKKRYNINSRRIYLAGFSMGGRGAYAIGLKNPDFFAAIAPCGPATDMFEIAARKNGACKDWMMSGCPGTNDYTDTLYKITSARFLIENAYNLPVFHSHGLLDSVAKNVIDTNEYKHGFDITINDSFDGTHIINQNQALICNMGIEYLKFDPTPTLKTLSQNNPSGYSYGVQFTNIGHNVDSKWINGGELQDDEFGVDEDLNLISSGNMTAIGIMEFFDKFELEKSPETIVYKSYTDDHDKAYWLRMFSATPDLNQPSAIRAIKNISNNSLNLEVNNVAKTVIDLKTAKLDTSIPMTVNIDLLNDHDNFSDLNQIDEVYNMDLVLRASSNLSNISVSSSSNIKKYSHYMINGSFAIIKDLNITGSSKFEISFE